MSSRNAKNRFGHTFTPLSLAPLTRCPLVSVLVSNYNYGPFLGEAVHSVSQQTYQNFEIIVCDDGSTDDSRKVLESCQSLDPRIRVIYQANEGQSSALNAAFRESTGEIISFMDADDIFRCGKLRSVVDAFLSAPEAGLAIHRMMRVDKARKPLGQIPLLSRLPSGWYGAALNKLKGPKMLAGLPPCSGLSLRRAVADVIFPIPVSLRICSDTLMQILAPMMTPIVAIDELLGEYRIHGDNNGGRREFGTGHIEKLMFHENEIWNIWRNYVAALPQLIAANCILPPRSAPSMTEYAHARFSGDPSSRDLYRLALRSPRYQAMSVMYRYYWRSSIVMPDWLFRRSFALVYGQSLLKIELGRVLDAFRRMTRICGAVFARSKRSTGSTRRSVPSRGLIRISTVERYALRSSLKAMIAARRDSAILRYVASGAEKYLKAYNNEQNWHPRYNGEANALRTVAGRVDGAVLDVGANEGQWASMALGIIDARRLHCFEVAPQTFEKLKRNFGPDSKVTLNHYGLGSKVGLIDFYFYPDSSDRSSRYALNDGFKKEKITVSLVPGDDYISQRGIANVAFLKLDVEGMEMDVLRGLSASLRAGIIEAIQFEHGPAHVLAHHLLRDFLELLEGYSYTVFRIFPKTLVKLEYNPEKDESFVGQNLLAVRSQILNRLPNLS